MSTRQKGYVVDVNGLRFVGRYIKPGFQYYDVQTVQVSASSNAPAYFIIGSRLFTVTSNLRCRFSTGGAGGLRTGLSVAASTIYYLYGVISNDAVALTMDPNPPSTGLQEFKEWTYIGAVATTSTSLLFTFNYNRGHYRAVTALSAAHQTQSATFVAAVLDPFPATAEFADVGVSCSGNNVTAWAAVSSAAASLGGTTPESMWAYQEVVGSANTDFGVIGITDSTLYIRVSNVINTNDLLHYGWIEDPSKYL